MSIKWVILSLFLGFDLKENIDFSNIDFSSRMDVRFAME